MPEVSSAINDFMIGDEPARMAALDALGVAKASDVPGSVSDLIEGTPATGQLAMFDGTHWIPVPNLAVSVFEGGDVAAAGTVAIDYADGPVQKFTATGSTLTLGVPAGGTDGQSLVVLLNTSAGSLVTLGLSLQLISGGPVDMSSMTEVDLDDARNFRIELRKTGTRWTLVRFDGPYLVS